MRDEWQCPCPECNGCARWPGAPDEGEEMFEPEHPENVSPARDGYDIGWTRGWGVYSA